MGAEPRFILWTNHKNLEYLHTAKRLMGPAVHTVQLLPLIPVKDPKCQAGCTVRCCSRTGTTLEPETIIPTSCLVTALNWGIGKQVWVAQRSQSKLGEALVIRCLCLMLSSLPSWSGPIPPGLPATQAPVTPWPSCDNAFGGIRWFRMLLRLSPPALSVLRIRLLGKL